jgi:hypothetical protein
MNTITSKKAPFIYEPGLVIVILFLILPGKEVMAVSREQILKLTSLSSCAG